MYARSDSSVLVNQPIMLTFIVGIYFFNFGNTVAPPTALFICNK